MIAEAVHRVSDVSTAPEALTIIRESLRSYLTTSDFDLARVIPGATNLGLYRQTLGSRFDDARKRLDLHLDGYRDTFGSAEVGKEETPGRKRGPKPRYDWLEATNAVWGRIHRGQLIPELQKDIELAMVAHLSKGNPKLETTTVRPYARLIWAETQFEPED